MKRQRRFRSKPAQVTEVQRLDDRQLLSVTPLSPQTDHHAGTDQHSVTLRWEDTEFATASTYQVWCDQQVNGVTVISRAFANDKVLVAGRQSSVTIPHTLQTGEYKLWVRRAASAGNQTWSTPLTFELDNDDNRATPLQRGSRPGRPDITVVREGQGNFGQASSEPTFGWASESTLHNVQLYKQLDDGRWVRAADLRSVAGRFITQRQLAAAAANGKATYFADLTNQTLNAVLPENRYRLWVQSINGAIDGSGNWIGVSNWTSPLDFQVNTITGSQAIPPNLKFTHGIRPTIQWDSVPASEHYMLSIQQGPDYANHPIVNVRIYGTQFQPSSHTINGSGGTVELLPGKEYFVRVRAVDQYGTAAGFRFGNYAFGKLLIPKTLPATSVQPPAVNGPTGTTFDAFPVINWDHQTNAEAYEVWVSDLQLNRRILLATRITDNFLPLNIIQLQSRSNTKIENTVRWSSETGLADGRYRFWVRSVNSTATGNTHWSREFDFTIDSGSIQTIETAVDTPVSRTPLIGAGHILELTGQATPSIVMGTGRGESFGQSILARYILTDDAENPWQRPIFIDGQTGLEVLQFPDLAVGRNISGMKQMPNGWIAVTCRSSADLYIIDPVLWRVVSRFDFSSANEPAPQPMGLDVLANGQIVVALRSFRPLRVLSVNTQGQMIEDIPSISPEQLTGMQMANAVSGISAAGDRFTLFISSSDLRGTVVLQYSPEQRSFRIPTQLTSAVISRDLQSNPLAAGTFITLSSPNSTSRSFFFAADRNGFMTWVDTVTLDFGFVDLARFLPDVSRDPASPWFTNSDDNGVDSASVTTVSSDHILVGNVRRSSVLLRLSLGEDAVPEFMTAAVLPSCLAATSTQQANSTTILRVWQSVLMSDAFSKVDGTLTPVSSQQQNLSVIVDRSIAVNPWAIVSKQTNAELQIVQVSPYDGRLTLVSTIGAVADAAGRWYRTDPWDMAVAQVADDRTLLVITGFEVADQLDLLRIPTAPTVLIIIDISILESPTLHSVIELPVFDFKPYVITASVKSIIMLDRYKGDQISISNWHSGKVSVDILHFSAAAPSGSGASRIASVVSMNEATNVFLHDTSPDSGFSVIQQTAPGAPRSWTYHAQSTGSSLWRIARLDETRIVGVTYDGRLLVFNTTTGIFEANIPLDSSAEFPIGIPSADWISFQGDRLVVGSKISGRVSVFEIHHAGASGTVATTIRLLHTISAPEITGAELTEGVLWITEHHRVRRMRL